MTKIPLFKKPLEKKHVNQSIARAMFLMSRASMSTSPDIDLGNYNDAQY